MNNYVTLLPITILILAGTGIVSQAFAVTITIETDGDVYDHSSIITITGTVVPVDANEVPVTIMIINPQGSIASIAQISVDNDGSFSTTISTAASLMKNDGIYEIRANYGNAKTTTSVELTDAKTSEVITGQVITGKVVTGADGESLYDGQVTYDVTCNATPSFFVNQDAHSIVIYITPTDDGILTITLHEELIKPLDDGGYFVLVDNEEVEFEQSGNILTIPCMAGIEKIEIYGSWVIPEFGVIAGMILAVAIVSIIVVTAKTKLSIVPRY